VFNGVAVALVTIFRDGGALDAPATADLASRLVECGVRAVVVAGSTGEAAALDAAERAELVRAVRAAVRVPVVAGTGAPSAHQAAAFTRAAVDAGADAVLVLSPPGSDDVRPYYDEVAKHAVPLPMLAYHYPRVSAPGIPVEVVRDLPVVGMKDSSGDASRLLHELDVVDRHFALYTGSAALLLLAGRLGCAGAILALANAEPELCVRAFAGDADAQQWLAAPERAAHRSFPRGIKDLTAARFGTATASRMG
jgi:4-hydroxy-tetrahydrodipicolinate synthase